MAGQLSDDGTMDTVISCVDCGEEQRYTYQPVEYDGTEDQQDALDSGKDERLYMAWVHECIEDFDESHECGESEEGSDDDE